MASITSIDTPASATAPAGESTGLAPATSSGPTILTQPPPPANLRESRIATHSHIKGLGLADDGTAMEHSQGFVGQRQAREALGLHLSLLRLGRHSGRPLLLVGPPGTGKVSPSHSSSLIVAITAKDNLECGIGSRVKEGHVIIGRS